MRKRQLTELLEEYERGKGLVRILFGDDIFIEILKIIVDKDLSHLSDDDTSPILQDPLRKIYNLLRFRKTRLELQDHYFCNHRLTNHIFFKLIMILAQDLFDEKVNVLKKTKQYLDTYESFQAVFDFISADPDSEHTLVYIFLQRKLGLLRSSLSKVQLDQKSFPHLIVDFRYKEVLGIRNVDRLYIDDLEDLDPQLLFLTPSNDLIYLPDVRQLFIQNGTIQNPASRISEKKELCYQNVQTLLVTKPAFFYALTEIERNELAQIQKNGIILTQAIVDKIRSTGVKMKKCGEKETLRSGQFLNDLWTYIELLPSNTCDFLLDYELEYCLTLRTLRTKKQALCQHEIGNDLVAMANKLQPLVTDDKTVKNKLLPDKYQLNLNSINDSYLVNGLRCK